MKKKKNKEYIWRFHARTHYVSVDCYSRTGNWLVLLGNTNQLSIIFVKINLKFRKYERITLLQRVTKHALKKPNSYFSKYVWLHEQR